MSGGKKRTFDSFYSRDQEEVNLRRALSNFYATLLTGGSHGMTEEIKTKKGKYANILKHERFDIRYDDDFKDLKDMVNELHEAIERFDVFLQYEKGPKVVEYKERSIISTCEHHPIYDKYVNGVKVDTIYPTNPC